MVEFDRRVAYGTITALFVVAVSALVVVGRRAPAVEVAAVALFVYTVAVTQVGVEHGRHLETE